MTTKRLMGVRYGWVWMITAISLAGSGLYLWWGHQSYILRIPESQLEAILTQQLPKQKRYLLFDLSFQNPRLDLLPGQERLQASFDLAVRLKLSSQPRSLTGEVTVSTGIRYNSEQGQFFLSDPVVESLQVPGVSEFYIQQAEQLLTQALTEYFALQPIYTFKPSDPKQAAVKFILKDIAIQDENLIIQLGRS